jgi:pyruvate dehydrogenase E2 component (dihydrolipoamide acetyltransferase)
MASSKTCANWRRAGSDIMAVEVIFPKVDMDMDHGTISKWHVKDGDTVKKGQAVFEIETDKSAMEIESPGEGVIKLSDVREGVSVAIGTVVAMIYAAGEAAKSFSSSSTPTVIPANTEVQTSPNAPAQSLESRVHGTDGGGGIRATPLARRLAKQAGVALTSLTGSGPRGRITSADIKAKQPAKPVAAVATNDTATIRALYKDGTYDVKPLDGMRRTIAQRLVQSKQTVPHFYLSATCTIDTLMATRERLNNAAPKSADKTPAYKLSINDFIIKAMAVALQKVPAANVTFTDDGILQHRASDVGVAVSVEGGLFTPVLRNAETKTLSAISTEMKDLATRARARKLQSHEYQGGTAAISNLGMFGVEQFTAIINPPHATILAVGAAVERFIPVKKQPVLSTQMTVTLSCDHRAVDGAVGAELLAAFKALIEDPALMLV